MPLKWSDTADFTSSNLGKGFFSFLSAATAVPSRQENNMALNAIFRSRMVESPTVQIAEAIDRQMPQAGLFEAYLLDETGDWRERNCRAFGPGSGSGRASGGNAEKWAVRSVRDSQYREISATATGCQDLGIWRLFRARGRAATGWRTGSAD